MVLPCRRKGGRRQRSLTGVVKEDKQGVGVAEEDTVDEVRWRQLICCGDP